MHGDGTGKLRPNPAKTGRYYGGTILGSCPLLVKVDLVVTMPVPSLQVEFPL